MNDEGQLVLIVGVLLAAGLAASLAAGRLRMPGLVLVLGLGMAIGTDGLDLIDFRDFELARQIGVVALAFILFEGGLSAGFGEIRPVLRASILLATLGTLGTAALTAFVAELLFPELEPLEALLLGSTVAATDAAAVFAVLRTSTLRRRLARTLEGESGINDPIAILLVIGCIEALQDSTWGVDDALVLVVEELAIGFAIGLAVAALAVLFLRRITLPVGRPLSRRLRGHGSAGVRRSRHAARLRLPRRLPRRPRPRHRLDPRPADGRHVPRGPRLGRPARAVPHARPARLPVPGDRLRLAGRAGRVRHRRAGPACGRRARHPRAGVHAARAADARLGGAAWRDADRVRHLPGHGRARGRPADLQRGVLRGPALDRHPGDDDRAGSAAAGRDVRRGGDPGAARRAGAAQPPGRRGRCSSRCAGGTRWRAIRCGSWGCRGRRCST